MKFIYVPILQKVRFNLQKLPLRVIASLSKQ